MSNEKYHKTYTYIRASYWASSCRFRFNREELSCCDSCNRAKRTRCCVTLKFVGFDKLDSRDVEFVDHALGRMSWKSSDTMEVQTDRVADKPDPEYWDERSKLRAIVEGRKEVMWSSWSPCPQWFSNWCSDDTRPSSGIR